MWCSLVSFRSTSVVAAEFSWLRITAWTGFAISTEWRASGLSWRVGLLVGLIWLSAITGFLTGECILDYPVIELALSSAAKAFLAVEEFFSGSSKLCLKETLMSELTAFGSKRGDIFSDCYWVAFGF